MSHSEVQRFHCGRGAQGSWAEESEGYTCLLSGPHMPDSRITVTPAALSCLQGSGQPSHCWHPPTLCTLQEDVTLAPGKLSRAPCIHSPDCWLVRISPQTHTDSFIFSLSVPSLPEDTGLLCQQYPRPCPPWAPWVGLAGPPCSAPQSGAGSCG